MKVALCAIIPRFKFTLVEHLASMKYIISLTMPIKDGLKVYVTKRED